MSKLTIMTLLFLAFSCNQSTNKEKKNSNKIVVKQEKQIKTVVKQEKHSKIDSLVVVYYKATEASEYYFYYSNKVLQIRNKLYGFRKSVNNEQTIRTFLMYVDTCYMNKERKIVLNRTRRDYIESTDYSNIKGVGYKNKKEIFNVKTKIGEEQYDVEYNPKFLEFYDFLDNLVKQK